MSLHRIHAYTLIMFINLLIYGNFFLFLIYIVDTCSFAVKNHFNSKNEHGSKFVGKLELMLIILLVIFFSCPFTIIENAFNILICF